jgi:hypothetical protein
MAKFAVDPTKVVEGLAKHGIPAQKIQVIDVRPMGRRPGSYHVEFRIGGNEHKYRVPMNRNANGTLSTQRQHLTKALEACANC